MKNSGIEWIGEIPDSWKLVNIGNVLKEHKQENKMLDTRALQFKYGTIVPKKELNLTQDALDILTKYNVVSPNIIMVNGLNLAFDFVTQRVALVKENGVITSTYIALAPQELIVPEYATYTLKAFDSQKVFHSLGRGLRCMLSYDVIKREKMPLPSLAVQRSIVNCLVQKLGEVDKLIEVQQAQIDKLKEYKQSVITEAVTKGLDPTVPMKDSGVEWIGMIPESWNVMRLKNAIESHFSGCWGEEPSEDDGILCIRIADFDFGKQIIKSSASTKRRYSTAQLEKGLLQDGDLILEKSGGGEKTSVGRVVVFEQKKFPDKAMFANFSECLRVKRQLHNEKYCAYLLKALYYTKDMSCFYHQTTGIQNLDIAEYLSMNLCFPSQKEQDLIVACLDKKLVEIDKLISIKQSKIDKLQEYKKSLIYEYVTGKKEIV